MNNLLYHTNCDECDAIPFQINKKLNDITTFFDNNNDIIISNNPKNFLIILTEFSIKILVYFCLSINLLCANKTPL